jgi:hypothetical protein
MRLDMATVPASPKGFPILYLCNTKNLIKAASLLAALWPGSTMLAAPLHHEACLKAVDYAGCVQTLSGQDQKESTTLIRIDQTNRPGLLSEMGNQCPAGYGYAGGGRCRSVICKGLGIFGKNQKELAGKGHRCGGGAEALNQGILWGRGTLAWGNDYVNASFNPGCPAKEMNIGDLSTCPYQESVTAQ